MKKVLFINPFGIGDALFTMALVEAVKQAKPELHIGFLCNERSSELVRLNASIDSVYVFHRDHYRALWKRNPGGYFKEFFKFWSQIRNEGYDTVFDLSLGREFAFYAMLIGIRDRIGFDYKGRGVFLTRKTRLRAYEYVPVAQTQLSLLRLASLRQPRSISRPPLAVSNRARIEMRSFFHDQGILEYDKVLAIAPGGGRSWGENAIYKQWDAGRFSRVAEAWGSQPRQKIVLLGDRHESELVRGLEKSLSFRVPVLLDLPMEKLCATLLASDVLLCNDGGLLHLGNALGVKTVSIFGPVDERVYGPFWDQAPSTILRSEVSCRPCYQNFHFPVCQHQRQCLDRIQEEEVLGAVQKMA